MIRNIQLHHTGKYVCMVQTTLDSQSTAVDVIVRGKFIKCRRISSGGISISQHQLLFKKSQDESKISVTQGEICAIVPWRFLEVILSCYAVQQSREQGSAPLSKERCHLLLAGHLCIMIQAKIKRPGLFPLFEDNMKDHFL